MKLLTFVFSGLAFSLIAFADPGMPKRGLLVTNLAEPAQTVVFSDIDLSLTKGSATKIDLRQPVTVTIGKHVYDVFDAEFLCLKNPCNTDVKNITLINFVARSRTVKSVVVRMRIDMRAGKNEMNANYDYGKVTEFY